MNAPDRIICHITTASEWRRGRAAAFFEPASLATEGFVHCSAKEQVDGVLKRFFGGSRDLVVLLIELSRLEAEVRYEPGADVDELFPHLYGPIPCSAVRTVAPVRSDGEGNHVVDWPLLRADTIGAGD